MYLGLWSFFLHSFQKRRPKRYFPPNFLALDKKRYEIPGYYVVESCRELENYELLCNTFLRESKSSFTVLSNSFFIRNYVVFDKDKNEVGFFQKTIDTLKNEIYRARNNGTENTVYRRILEDKKSEKETIVADKLGKFGSVISTLETLESGTGDDIEYLIYILVGVDVILLTIIIAFLWRKRYVVATGDWQDLLEV